jgi:excisionase family DNA binding protein
VNEIIEIDEAAAILKCSVETLTDNLRSGHLPGLKLGVPWIIPRQAFYARLNEIAVEEAVRRRQAREPAAPPPAPITIEKVGRRNRLVSFDSP